ncbi:hypothetical protein GOEFS_109_00050 [Gordonia effusa NBRC 100432]|uniref:Uncharacterized protein n=1 Tax=Gordonia effusa NBRC 100432 TaxID=1077974 RepID=H0R5A9_9ACTN|nr:hypothetical protein [Gordonia effusa]GAB20260.1 hypothetical protein GOEFS_109_00050 [Gordonia effusa NBRC 100432]
MNAKADGGLDLSQLLRGVESSVMSGLLVVEWAEDEIRCAAERWPEHADVLFHAFGFVRPRNGVGRQENLYRSYARELLERLVSGEDTRLGTTAEVLLALCATSLNAPLSHVGLGLYFRLWETAGMPPVSDDGVHYEALSAVSIDAAEIDARRFSQVAERMFIPPEQCDGLHHGRVVACRYAKSPL